MSEKLERELRSIKRRYDELQKPLHISGSINLDAPPNGLRLLKPNKLSFPHESILDKVHDFSQSVWHFKEYLKDHNSQLTQQVESLAAQSIDLLICADLANAKKHATLMKPRTQLSPQLGILHDGQATINVVEFDLSRSGTVEFFYEGKTKKYLILAENNFPISFRVDMLVSGKSGLETKGNAIDFIFRASQSWLIIMKQLNITVRNDFLL